jgi:hypothetical protein
MQTIIIKVNKVKFTIEFEKIKKFYLYSLHRNKRILMTGQAPLSYKQDIKLGLAAHLFEQITWEIKHELEKIKL